MKMRSSTRFIVIVLFSLAAACSKSDQGSTGQAGSAAGASVGTAGAGGSSSSAGVTCANYCSLAIGKMCTGSLQIYADTTACQAGCAMIKTPGTVNDMAGNTLGCRIYHLTLANMNATNAMTHCPHGAVVSAVCN
jgi:hypothetical protein